MNKPVEFLNFRIIDMWISVGRPFHWLPKIYEGVNGVTTRLLVWGSVCVEFTTREH